MKKILAIVVFALAFTLAHAQYITGYDALQKGTLDENIDIKKVKFDVDSLKTNGEAYALYQEYNRKLEQLYKDRKTCGYMLVGSTALCSVPLIMMATHGSDENFSKSTYGVVSNILGGVGIISGGLLVAVVLSKDSAIRSAKRDLVSHLNASHNGLGVVYTF